MTSRQLYSAPFSGLMLFTVNQLDPGFGLKKKNSAPFTLREQLLSFGKDSM